MNFFLSPLIFLICLVGMDAARSEVLQSKNVGNTECVGRYQISPPGLVDVATTIPLERFSEGYQASGNFLFAKDDRAFYSDQLYEGAILTGPSISDQKFDAFRLEMQEFRAQRRLARGAEEQYQQQVKNLPFKDNPSTFYLWSSGYGTVSFIALRSGRLFQWRLEGYPQEFDANVKTMLTVEKGLRARALFELPKESGVCIPYGFVADDGKPGRKIGVTMRLIEHPEVEIFFQDETPASNDLDETKEINFFWEDNYRQPDRQRRLLSPHVPGITYFPSVKIAGRKGKYSFVEITRQDGSLDYGYLAYVKGDAKTKEDTPNLMLYVIRTAARAKGEPIGKNEFKKLADEITASIRRRPVQ
ncbi:MAG: hypothetical protein JWL63_3318 [Rhodocyclales bacterium]|nr:hypothetical protein [Rhodocyclales bacterium]